MSDDFLALPAFKPAEALIQLKRSLRELRPLAERGEGFELQGQRVVELAIEGAAIVARIAKRPARSPEFERRVIKDSAQLRQCVAEVKKRLAAWIED